MEPQITFIEGNSSNQDEPEAEEESMVEYSTVEVEEHDNDGENDHEDGEDDDESVALETLPVHFQKVDMLCHTLPFIYIFYYSKQYKIIVYYVNKTRKFKLNTDCYFIYLMILKM